MFLYYIGTRHSGKNVKSYLGCLSPHFSGTGQRAVDLTWWTVGRKKKEKHLFPGQTKAPEIIQMLMNLLLKTLCWGYSFQKHLLVVCDDDL